MYVLSDQGKGIPRDADSSLVGVFRSINEAKTAVAGRPAEQARAFICTFSRDPSTVEVKVVLFLTGSRARLIYGAEEGACAAKERKTREAAALAFVEGMGFMMDNMNLPRLTPADRLAVLSGLPVFEEPSASVVLGEIEKAELELESSKARISVPDVPVVSRPEKRLEENKESSEDSLSLGSLEGDFDRVEIGIGEVDSALDEVLGSLEPESTPVPERIPRKETGDSIKWRTIVRFLASF
ncbi:MAG: hypothetical protein V1495_02310 [Pseudomonadota bacterium]